jgi:tetratricopeptide (TPR) repeat protein/predicted Ser/Thr protein kinase
MAAQGDVRVNERVGELFHQVAELSPEARAQYFVDHHVDDETRREVEALLVFDSGASDFLLRDIRVAANRALSLLDVRSRRCGPYRLLDVVGRGGMGAVYLAERADGEVKQQLAIKLLPLGAGDPQRERFLQERQILATLAHPNIARMLDAGHLENGQPFLAMEYIDGKSIDAFTSGLGLKQKISVFLKVCAGVGYLHQNLVVHRDLKPSNILVTADGEPKLLDFGIAKFLDLATDSTMTSMRMLTPDYASPEQVTGGRLSTATDIYSLGAVLYRLLTGKTLHEFMEHSPEAIASAVTTREVTRPSKWSPELKGDVEFILMKALRKDPNDRYTTVEHFAEDLQAFLESRVVRARSGNAWYRARKFLRRYWVPVTAAAFVIAALSLGLYVANRERANAQRRFQQVRQLANKVIALDLEIRTVPGSTKTRQEIVAMSKEYLEGLNAEAHADPALALELGTAYVSLAHAQGVPITSNLGMYDQAEESLIKADSLMETVLRSSPRNLTAQLALAEISQDRMILADSQHRDDQARMHAGQAVSRLEKSLALGEPTHTQSLKVAQLFNNIALAYKNFHLYDESVRYARRSIEISKSEPSAGRFRGNALSLIADALRFSGDLQGAFEAVRDAHENLDALGSPKLTNEKIARFNVLWREGVILGGDGQISLERPDDAVVSLQEAFDIIEGLAKQDPDDANSRSLFQSAGREMGSILGHHQPERALAVFNHALSRLREVKNNVKARRGEAQLLAASSYPLRRVNRVNEARLQIDNALQILRETKDYPADRIELDDELDTVLRGWADHLAETGQPQRAAEVYQELLDKIMASHPDPQNDLRNATSLAHIYETLAALHLRNGRAEPAQAMSAVRLELWQNWNRKLPQNPFIRKQLDAASAR